MTGYKRITKPGLRPTTKDGRTWNPWHQTDLAYLRTHHAATPDAALATALGKTVSAVRSKSHALGLKKSLARLVQMGRENVSERRDRRRKNRQ